MVRSGDGQALEDLPDIGKGLAGVITEYVKTHDWVVIYFERDGREDQATVVTGSRGSMEGKRVVRGREAECERFYAQQEQAHRFWPPTAYYLAANL